MEYLWSIYGVSMELACCICGKSGVYLWSIYGVSMEYLWSIYEVSMKYLGEKMGVESSLTSQKRGGVFKKHIIRGRTKVS
jgi:hypothetical protein